MWLLSGNIWPPASGPAGHWSPAGLFSYLLVLYASVRYLKVSQMMIVPFMGEERIMRWRNKICNLTMRTLMFRPHKAMEYQHQSKDFSLLRNLTCLPGWAYYWNFPWMTTFIRWLASTWIIRCLIRRWPYAIITGKLNQLWDTNPLQIRLQW